MFKLFKKSSRKKLEKLPSDFGIIVVDMQELFFKYILDGKKKNMIDAQTEIINVAAKYNYPVIVLEFEGCGETFPKIKYATSKVLKNKTVMKENANGFEKTDLVDTLNELEVQSVGLMGVFGSRCVMETAQGAITRNINYLTAETLIADNYLFGSKMHSHLKFSTIDWHKENALIYFQNHKKLIELMEGGC
jgi:hypothetical protein